MLTNHAAVRRVDMYRYQGHKCALHAVRLRVRVHELISINK